ncbi:MAG: SRPBCC domain-containing protein [Devosia nanyangense]|uniref:SRPBCC domain-containing protein n=1 Tax=Devosia nanyangense TaxID=1228055 RepID=A0A933KZR8_9HYPH|nr:SRPBCC domain-containing protein [Devosia nanyangense]
MAARPHTVYAALVDAGAVAKWLPPSNMTGRILDFDPRPGGPFRMELTFKDKSHATPGKTSADSDLVEGRFVSLVADREIVQRFTFRSDDPAFAGEMTMTWTLVPEAGGTRVTVSATDVPPGISPDDHQTGLNSSLANLADYTE